jgi:hypothetical protein
MLMVSKDSRHSSIDMLRYEEKRFDTLIHLHRVFNSLSQVQTTIGRFQKNGVRWAPDWERAKKLL